jgi:hypothetical protein
MSPSMSRANGLRPNGLDQRRIRGKAGAEGPRLVAGQVEEPDVLLHELCEELRLGAFGCTEAFQWRCMQSIALMFSKRLSQFTQALQPYSRFASIGFEKSPCEDPPRADKIERERLVRKKVRSEQRV